MEFPKQFKERMKQLLGKEAEEFFKSYELPYYMGVRTNRLKITPEEFESISPFCVSPIPWIDNGFYYHKPDQPARHPFYFAGLYYIQEPSAMTPANFLPIEKGDSVLDLCAAPGGKSTELAAKLQGTGFLISNDISYTRAKALVKNLGVFGVKNAVVMSETPKRLTSVFGEYFDKILIDAPCSGEGMFRKDSAIMKNWEQYGVDYYNQIQKEIILYAADMLKPGGLMLYSTCTFSPEENEGTIQYLLHCRPEFSLLPLPKEHGLEDGHPEWVDGMEDLKHCVRIWPHKVKGEGHFCALLQKQSQSKTESSEAKIENPIPKRRKKGEKGSPLLVDSTVKKFLEEAGIDLGAGTFMEKGDKIYYMPKGLPELGGLRILRTGLYMGDKKKNHFEPSQPFAMALQNYPNVLSLSSSSEDAIRYLKCETLEVKPQKQKEGLYLIQVDRYPLGWGKLTGTMLKNKYFAGWRWM